MTDKHLIETMKICCAGACDYWSCNYDFDKHPECMESLLQDALELIQRQQERIERLKDNLDAVLAERAALDVDEIIERLERVAYETADWMCGGTMKAVELTDAIEIVKGGAE